MMKRLYALSKKCEENFGISAEYLCLFLSIVVWLLIGVAAAFVFSEFCRFEPARGLEMMKTMGSICGISVGYVYGLIWLMRHAK